MSESGRPAPRSSRSGASEDSEVEVGAPLLRRSAHPQALLEPQLSSLSARGLSARAPLSPCCARTPLVDAVRPRRYAALPPLRPALASTDAARPASSRPSAAQILVPESAMRASGMTTQLWRV